MCVCMYMAAREATCTPGMLSAVSIKVPLKLSREVIREKGHVSLWNRKGTQTQVSLAPAKGGRGKAPGLPLKEGDY